MTPLHYVPLAFFTVLASSSSVFGFEAWPRNDQNSKTAHAQLLEKAKTGKIDLYFLGDSITRRWGCTDTAYQDLMKNWRSHFHGWNAGNFGWGGDTTHNVLWRIENGELDGVQPKVIVLQAGTNDIGWRTYDEQQAAEKIDEIAAGIGAILTTCHQKAPDATLILTGVFPRGDNPGVAGMITTLNKRLAAVASEHDARFLNINDQLTDTNGQLLEGVTVDGLHLSTTGYDTWAAALEPHLTELLGPRSDEDLAPPPTGDPSAAK